MNSFAKHLGRREFLKKGITGGAMIAAFPHWESIHFSAPQLESNSQRLDDSSNESYGKLLKIVQTYGGEFGNTRGGL